MNNKASSLPLLLERSNITDGGHLTLIRDGTEASDAIPLVLNIAKALTIPVRSGNAPTGVIFLSTRSRSQYPERDEVHVYPVLSRAASVATASCVSLDPYTMQSPDFSTSDLDFQGELTNRVIDTAHQKGSHVIVIECLHSLKVVFGVNPSAFVRSLLSPTWKLSVLAACPIACGIDDDITSLSDIADSVFDLQDLQTGAATDVDGILKVSKEKGRWKPTAPTRRYQVTEASFKIYT